MKLCVAQIRPSKGDIQQNMDRHAEVITQAASLNADLIIFPELSLTGYEPQLAHQLATTQDDGRFDQLQALSDIKNISIGVGVPVRAAAGVMISTLIFQPNKLRQTYSKQYLHEDELPYFIPGDIDIILEFKKDKIAPAICYESLIPAHAEKAADHGAKVYLASVAKSAQGIKKAHAHYSKIANRFSMTVLMANSVGPCDKFDSAGNSAIWNNKGLLVRKLDARCEGIIVFDNDTQEVFDKTIVDLP